MRSWVQASSGAYGGIAITASEKEIFRTIRNGIRKNSSSQPSGMAVTAARAAARERSVRRKLLNFPVSTSLRPQALPMTGLEASQDRYTGISRVNCSSGLRVLFASVARTSRPDSSRTRYIDRSPR